MFKIPETVVIGGHTYKIILQNNLARDNDSQGNSCGNNQTIKLDSSLPDTLKESTFVHEVLHQLDFIYHICLSHDQVYSLECAIYSFLSDNLINMREDETKDGAL